MIALTNQISIFGSGRCGLMVLLASCLVVVCRCQQELQPKPEAQSNLANSYVDQARKFFDSGMEAHQPTKAGYSSGLMQNEDPRTLQMLRDNINKATGSCRLWSNKCCSNKLTQPTNFI